jgi:hypothetical protein
LPSFVRYRHTQAHTFICFSFYTESKVLVMLTKDQYCWGEKKVFSNKGNRNIKLLNVTFAWEAVFGLLNKKREMKWDYRGVGMKRPHWARSGWYGHRCGNEKKERKWLIKMLIGGSWVEDTDLRGEHPDLVQNNQNEISLKTQLADEGYKLCIETRQW